MVGVIKTVVGEAVESARIVNELSFVYLEWCLCVKNKMHDVGFEPTSTHVQ